MEKERAGTVLLSVGAMLGMLVMLWALALGPLVRWAPDSSHDTLRVIYAPALWAHETETLHGPLEWYVNLWERH